MKKIVIFDTSQGTLNMGDHIIVESCMNQMKEITSNNFIVRVPTHTPLYHFHQNFTYNLYKPTLKQASHKFILGSNLLYKDVILSRKRPWNIHFSTSKHINDVILVGVGSNNNSKRSTFYTRQLYKKVLSSKAIHSVRDHYTLEFVQSLGLKAINTGCPTMWNLTEEHCKSIPQTKAKNVIFTLTDYAIDVEKDTYLIEQLISNYDNIYFWPQGSEDYDYFISLGIDSNIIVVDSSLDSYKEILINNEIDYIGSRLHGGIYALQHGIRTLIVAVDDRAINKQIDYNLPVIDRKEIRNELIPNINEERKTSIKINSKGIQDWKNQFLVLDTNEN